MTSFTWRMLVLSMFVINISHPAIGGTCGRLEKVQMTIMSFRPQNSEATDTHYECYLGNGDGDAKVTAQRAYTTRNGNGVNPPPSSVHQLSGLPPSTSGHYVTLRTGNNAAFGAFYCTATKTGKEETKVMTIFIRSNGYATTHDMMFTQTVDVGDRGTVIDIDYTYYGRFRRRLNSSAATTDDLSGTGDYIGMRDRVARLTDNGLHEFHFRNGREDGTHCLKRMIVRSCSGDKWGPPWCSGICDNCYNGGVCDDKTGRCICPPGFMGTNCLTGCGGNQFGYSCEFECIAGDEYGCRKRQFCLLDPFGCRCNTGFKGLACDSTCLYGTFGAGCLQTCHCASGSCNLFTGVCITDGCHNGWSGVNCQSW